jgi:acetyl esterase/lipase
VRYDGGRRFPWVWDFAGQYNVLEPKHIPIPKRRGIVFNIHGGGFMCSQDEDYYPALSFLARLGYTVIGVDYPLSPQSRFPDALVAVLQAIHHATMTFLPSQDMECFVLGDSAGANLALLAALLISNDKALQLFASTLDKKDSIDVQKLVLPRIDGVLSIYGEGRDWVSVIGLGLVGLEEMIQNDVQGACLSPY